MSQLKLLVLLCVPLVAMSSCYASEANPYQTGLEYIKQDKTQAAIDSFTIAIKNDPKNKDAFLQRSRAYSAQYDYDKAIRDCNKVLRLDPENADAYFLRAVARVFADASKGELALESAYVQVRNDLRKAAKYATDPELKE